MKSIIAAGFLLGCAQGAIAGPYANVETNVGYTGDTYGGTVTETHAGYDFGGWYVQGGPAFVNPRGEEGRAEFSGKVGGTVVLNEDTDLYGEVSLMTEDKSFEFDDLDIGVKAGVTYRF